MRAICVAGLLLSAAAAFGAEAWFLPYEPDEDTLLLLHLDEGGEEQPNLGTAPVDGQLVKGAESAEGVFGRGAELEGGGECVRVPFDESLRLAVDQPFTIECWFRPDSAEGTIFSVSINYYLAAHYNRGTASFGYRAETFPIRWHSPAGIPWRRGRWQHVAVTHQADRTVRLYLNGRLVAETQHADEGTYTEKGGSCTFGSHDGWRAHLRGAFDEIRISSVVREFQPLLTERVYLDGESVQLDLGDVELPERVTSIRVRITSAAGEELLSRELPVGEANAPLLEAERLGDGEAEVSVEFLDAAGERIATLTRPVSYGGGRMDELQRRTEAIEDALADADPDLPERGVVLQALAAARDRLQRRDLDLAGRYLTAAERRVHAIATGEAAYRLAVRRHVRAERDEDVRITMSWSADDAEAALPWAERIGANELVTPHGSASREGLARWVEEGYHTAMLSSAPIHTAEEPDHLQFGYWYMDTQPAQGESVTLKLQAPEWGGMKVSDFFPPAEHWRIVDTATDEELPPHAWEYDHPSRTVTINQAQEGRVYRVYYLNETTRIGDLLHEPFAEHALEVLTEEVERLEGVLETFWYDDLAFAWPGRNPQGGYDWESYTNAARPENQWRFTEDTGIEFDPRWLVMPPRTLDVPPQPEYLPWMQWVQEHVKPWMRRATDVVHERGARTWLYWGDCHVGIEPYLGSLEAGNVDEVDKPSGDPVTARALVDFPGDVYRRMRVDWLHSHLVARPDGAALYAGKWDRARRGLLMQPPEGLYWMPMPNAAELSDDAIREDVVEQLAQISDEFRLMARLGRARAWEGAANLYVVHSWGRQYSWRPWGDRVLWHLTDLPVRVRFISFRDVIQGGVPEDAHCLFLYGLPGTAWSGGYIWEDERLADAIQGFVRAGGGVVGLQASSALEDGWALADVFGVTGAPASDAAEAAAAYSGDEWIDEEALAAAREEDGLSLARVQEAPIAGAEVIAGIRDVAKAVPIADDVTVAYALLGEDEEPVVGMTVREVGEGRAAWIAGWSGEYDFSRLLRATILWAAHREDQGGRLDVTGDDLFVYAYPDARTIALLSIADQPVEASVRCDPTILELPILAPMPISDVATGERLGTVAQLADGLTVTAIPHCVRLLRVGE
ncbi:MAG: 1,3-beta-galactosyl-N-acetylhexosamine phosphorylase N-terminal domain-containing protein [Armatimonadota bacterium]|nr:1,3-beta-galactosyl-N-acetylhexosamine phosphorylase N-terminal domain-containing protein [Armatimonadota bacterium]